MKKFLISAVGGFFINNAMAGVIAASVLNPLLNASFEGTVRTEEQGLNMIGLLGGYLILTVLMVCLYPRITWRRGWFSSGLTFGLLMGTIVFISGHLIVAGWSIIPIVPMFISGILDSLAPAASGVFIAFIYRHGNT